MLQTISARIDKKLLSKFSFTEPHCFQVYISLKCSETNWEVFSLERKYVLETSILFYFEMKMWSKYLAANLTIIWSKPLKFRVFFPRFFFYYSFNCVKRIRFCVCFYLWVYQFISRANSISPVLLLEHEIKPTLCGEKKNCSSAWNLMENSQTMGHSVNTLSEFSRNCNKKRRMLCCCIVCAYQRTGKIWTLIIMVGRMMAFGNRKQCKKKN